MAEKEIRVPRDTLQPWVSRCPCGVLANRVPGLFPYFNHVCSSVGFGVPCEISSEESSLKHKALETIGAPSTIGKGARMWRGTYSVVPPPGKNLKLRVNTIELMTSKAFFSSKTREFPSLGSSPWTTISLKTPPMLWSDNDLDKDIGPAWPSYMGLITLGGL